MDVNLCRCCLSSNFEVSLLDSGVKEKFFEITCIEVKEEDGLPQKLCSDCNTILNSAYQFRKQCIKMDSELKFHLEAVLNQSETITENNIENLSEIEDFSKLEQKSETEIISNNPMKQLEAIIKKEPTDSDDDFYYVLVIDDPKDKKIDSEIINNIKIEQSELSEQIQENDKDEIQNMESEEPFENSIDSFLVSEKVPANVPATILENEEESQENDNFDNAMQVDETQDSNSQETNLIQFEDSQDKTVDNIDTIETISNIAQNSNNSFIKILTASTADGTILLKSNDNVSYLTEDKVTYLTDAQFVTSEDGDHLSQEEEVIFCEGDDASQFQIVKCEGSELVIEYDDGQIATVIQQEDGRFICECGESFEDLTEYEKHQIVHNPAGEHLCNMCGKGFETAEILSGHMLLHNVTGSLVKCPLCNQFIKRNALTQHIKYGHNNIKPCCSVCLKTFANPNNLKRHMMIHSGIKEFECDLCCKRFHQKITMQTHRLTHTNPFACSECELTFTNKIELTAHKDSNQCTKSKVLKVKEELMKTVKQEVTTSVGQLLGYACSLCKKMFSVEAALEQHIESTHIVDPAELLCSECGEILPTKRDMQSHVLTHKTMKSKNLKRFECSICGKGCASQAMLIMHERVHTNERPFPCQLCSLRFKTKTHLRTHQLTHTREKKFGCSVCMKFFALKGNLVVHLRTHTGERPYVCSLCDEAFIDSKYLKKHKLKKHAIDNVPWNKY